MSVRPLHVCILMEFPTLNGGERSMLSVLKRLPAQDFRFTILAPESGPLAERLSELNLSHCSFSMWDEQGQRLPRAEILRQLVERVQQLQPDLLHANSLAMGRLTGLASAQLRIPCLAHLRDIVKLSQATVQDLNRNHCLIAVSSATREFHAVQGIDVSRVRVLWNGVDCDRFAPRPSSGELKRELGLPQDSRLLLTIGQLGLRKGQDVLLAAAPEILQQFPNVHFLFVGEQHSRKGETVEYINRLRTAFAPLGKDHHLHLLGRREDVPWLMNECDLLVHPAHQEPLGRVLLEAAASGLPIVATSVGGTPEILENRISGLLVPAGNPPQLAIAILTLLKQPHLARSLAAIARKTAESRFSVETAAKGLAQIWKEQQSWGNQVLSVD